MNETPLPLRVFVAGGTGAIGSALVPQLLDRGYQVTAMTRTAERARTLDRKGVTAVVCDVFDSARLKHVVAEAHPHVVINQLTDLPASGLKPRKLAEYYTRNDRIRTEGNANLLDAARGAAARRYLAQSVAFFYEPSGDWVKDEREPLWTSGPAPFGAAAAAIHRMEKQTLDASDIEGVILRYGTFYGPHTWYSNDGEIGRQMKKRQYPIIGAGAGTTSFVHIEDASAACVEFVENGRPGRYNVVDDAPAPAKEWMPEFAAAIGARPPRRVPEWMARRLAGKPLVAWATTLRGASNARLRQEVDWRPRYPNWRQGFKEGLDSGRLASGGSASAD